jgi:hypothetical protein
MSPYDLSIIVIRLKPKWLGIAVAPYDLGISTFVILNNKAGDFLLKNY